MKLPLGIPHYENSACRQSVRLFRFCLLCAQVWDIRTKAHVAALTGHDNTVCSVFSRPTVRKHFSLSQATAILSSSFSSFI
jgi:hypothetical protein